MWKTGQLTQLTIQESLKNKASQSLDCEALSLVVTRDRLASAWI